jgi:hypothetical protein
LRKTSAKLRIFIVRVKAFSSEVGTGSREENALAKTLARFCCLEAGFPCMQNAKKRGLSPLFSFSCGG